VASHVCRGDQSAAASAEGLDPGLTSFSGENVRDDLQPAVISQDQPHYRLQIRLVLRTKPKLTFMYGPDR
jgi:hypothetical protein